MKAKKIKRSLAEIADAIRARTESIADIIAIGGDLLEAKRQLNKHGEWLPWLEREFNFSERTAQYYIKAHKFARKYETVADLKISRSALYELASEAGKSRTLYTAEAIAAIFKEAAEKRVSKERAYEIALDIAYSSHPKTAEEYEAEEAEAARREAEEEAEAEAILDGTPPELPPPEPAKITDFPLLSFDQAISKLKQLSTKHSDKFLNSSHSAADIEEVADFLFHISQTKAKAAA